MKEFYNLSIAESLSSLSSGRNGLSEKQVAQRQSEGATNDIAVTPRPNLAAKFFAQFKDLMIVILLIAAAISMVIGLVEGKASEIVDGVIILFIVIMNAIFGLVQEQKAERSLDALKRMTEPECYVRRGGISQKVSTKNIVPGDIVLLEAGSIVPADVRLIESVKLQIDESSLTGESRPANKNAAWQPKADQPLADRHNMAYRGTVVSGGRGVGLVTAIGADTEMGKIAENIKSAEKELSPLQKNIKDIGKFLTYLVLGIAFVTFLLEILARPSSPMEAFLTAVAISVAAIPESMPAVITIIMSMGIARLAKQKAVVKSIHSVETLGCCDVICSDKTGTITQNKMTVTSLFYNGKLVKSGNDCLEKQAMIATMLLCSNAQKQGGGFIGDGTEVALCGFAESLGKNKDFYDKNFLRLKEIPFSSERKIMSVINRIDGQNVMLTKGAADMLLPRCEFVLENGKVKSLSQSKIKEIERANRAMADKALRVLGFAYKICGESEDESGLVFVGLAGMIDPPRREIKKAVQKCHRAGMRAVMITGDHKDTAYAIAKECGIAKSPDCVLTGSQLDQMTEGQLDEVIEGISVFARVSPQNKVRIVEALKKKGHIVAMTGDGVNDAPSLKKANIGIGMGITGTDVTKEVADVLVTDDNFATIVVAVEEGRKIYQNIVKAVKFLFSANLGELLSLFLATVFFPNFVFLYPVQILFVNLITDSLPAIALGLEVPEGDLMQKNPRSAKKGLFADGTGLSIVVLGIVQTLLTIISFAIGLSFGGQECGVTMAFYTLNIIQMFYLASMRTNGSMLRSNPLKNKMFVAAIAFSFGLLGLIALTPLHSILKLSSLPPEMWLIMLGLCLAMMAASEIFKICYNSFERRKNKKKQTKSA